MSIVEGDLRKMPATLEMAGEAGKANYELMVGEQRIALNPLLGSKIKLEHSSLIHCVHCGRKTNKSFNQGFCYPCFKSLAQCDQCIVSPEKCHYHLGTCREPEWADQYCMRDHYVYLANSSGLKVGITRGSQVPTRWIDQGAVQALPVYRVQSRLLSGLVEVVFKEHISDKTNWRAMLKGDPEILDLQQLAAGLKQEVAAEIDQLQQEHGLQAVQECHDAEPVTISYPVDNYPVKVSSLNFDKTPVIEGVLHGIKGQYLMLESGVLNIRKFGGYNIRFSTE